MSRKIPNNRIKYEISAANILENPISDLLIDFLYQNNSESVQHSCPFMACFNLFPDSFLLLNWCKDNTFQTQRFEHMQ